LNIFVLSFDPHTAALFHCDKHIVKMPLETAQMLSTINGGPYKSTHANHPCTVWARRCEGNYSWLVRLGLELCREYTYRYKKVHKCQAVIEALKEPPATVLAGVITPFAQAMPEECQQSNAILAYQHYYATHKQHLGSWKFRSIPYFMEGVA
jgi:hypothetical protein